MTGSNLITMVRGYVFHVHADGRLLTIQSQVQVRIRETHWQQRDREQPQEHTNSGGGGHRCGVCTNSR